MAAREGTPAYEKASKLVAIYTRDGRDAAQAELDRMIADGLSRFEYVAITDTFRQLVKGS